MYSWASRHWLYCFMCIGSNFLFCHISFCHFEFWVFICIVLTLYALTQNSIIIYALYIVLYIHKLCYYINRTSTSHWAVLVGLVHAASRSTHGQMSTSQQWNDTIYFLSPSSHYNPLRIQQNNVYQGYLS